MQKGVKNISIFFILFAGLIFFSHAVIPHNHHFNPVLYSNQQSNHEDGHSENSPLHCHAFNDLAVDKLVITTNNISILKTVFLVGIENADYFSNSGRPNGSVNFLLSDDKILSFIFLKTYTTRAPPVLA